MSRTGFRAGDRRRANALFRSLPVAIRREVTQALEENAEELAEAIRRRVPTDKGDLADSVRWAKGKAAATSGGRQTRAAGADGDISVRVIEGDDDAFYAGHVEHGTVNHPAQPHFFPTYRQLRRKLKSRLNRAMRKAIAYVAANP
jgi:HK97 gp10 family phage protein